MKVLNSITCPIDNKVSLIEASAGTGKTYNIQNLFVRMIMERDFPIDSILVVTFTDSATKELKSRIRSILTELNHYFDTGTAQDFQRISDLAKVGNIDKGRKQKRIITALRNFDRASIFTIHGFCKKCLDENAFATASFFHLDLLQNSDSILEKIVQNFFRKYFYNTTDLEHLLKEFHGINFNSCLKFIKKLRNKAQFVFRENYQNIDFQRNYALIVQALKDSYDRHRLLEKLNKKVVSQDKSHKMFKEELLINSLDSIEQFFQGEISVDALRHLNKFCPENIKKELKRNQQLPTDLFFDSIAELFDLLKQYKHSVYQNLYGFFVEEFEKEKQSGAFRTFDDLIRVLENSLRKNPQLTQRISSNYKAVLIDEFQDTDALQYSIFSRIFIQQNKPTFLIGDPKQAIYSFRGGDIYTYKKAKADVQKSGGNLYTLLTNYRSSQKMVQGVNEFYGSLPKEKAFFSDFIEFHPVDAQKSISDKLLYKGVEVNQTLEIYYNSKSKNNNTRNEFSINQTIQKIYDLISDPNFQISEKGQNRVISPSDIAILVNTHHQAKALIPKLQEANIPAVIQATGSVFDSDEALALNRLLKAIDEPTNLKVLLGALTTFLFDQSAAEMFKMVQEDSSAVEKWFLFFRNCQKKWQKGSFIEVFNFILTETNIKQRLLSDKNGDRKITNLFHLQELIQKREIEAALGMSGTINWFNRQLNPDLREKNEDIELRLETDEKALKILTIHKSKGLEFPMVFCPFFWSQKYDEGKNEFLEYHNENNQLVIDFSREAITEAEKESLEEQIRLIYVALTRAKYKVFVTAVNNKNLSAIKYFLQQFPNENTDEILMELKQEMKELKDFSEKDAIGFKDCEINATKYINFQSDQNSNIPLQKHQFQSNLKTGWQISSFSSLISGNMENTFEEFKDYDEQESQPEVEADNNLNIFTFPAGAKVGSCWHEIFEEISFTDVIESIKAIASKKLSTYGILSPNANLQNDYIDITTNMVENVLQCKISRKDNIHLCHLSENQKISELEFFFSLHGDVKKTQINELLKSFQIAFNDDIPQGFLTGFIDLTFEKDKKYYILDWKSNALGENLQDFSPENIATEMHGHKYHLQYLIYTVALQKYLKQRIPDYDYEKHFGGVFYIFLRGVDKTIPESGVFYDCPDKDLITALEKLLS